jgi:hypothetical protein
VINRSTTRDTPIDPMALYLVALLFGTLVAETILASVHVRAHQQAGHIGASDLIKALQKHLARRGPSIYGSSGSVPSPHVMTRPPGTSWPRSTWSPRSVGSIDDTP